MTFATQDVATAGLDPQSADFLDRFAETMRAESGMDLPHAYFVEEARRRLAGGTVHHLVDHHTKPEQFQSSACFDAWAKGDEAA
ncbi:hypothetical protein GR138_03660 [Shinella kummerowiae]|jgi:hypothetical protein|uniref:Uncharacterized protein n=1 Tax=Shinella kummerowiae TaxID=417745 RepID=A0A6N8SBC8_9HYPH|nr:hypothetical protein [Shinella kummerowiae]MXN44272.1 hypothetical protein [Shinella kummerowiae]